MGGSYSDAVLERLCQRLNLQNPTNWDLDVSDEMQYHYFEVGDDDYCLAIDTGDFEYTLSKIISTDDPYKDNDLEIEHGYLDLIPEQKVPT